MPGFSDGQSLHAGMADSMHVPDRRFGTIPVEDRRAGRLGGQMMAKHRRLRWESVERVVRSLLSIAEQVARLIDEIRKAR